MRATFAFVFVLAAACTTEVERTDLVMVPTSIPPCTLDASCADGTDVDPSHDHTDDWRALPCEEACNLLLRSRKRIDDVSQDATPFWMIDEGSRNPKSIDACAPPRWIDGSGLVESGSWVYEEPGAWVISCTYPYDEPPPQELM